MQGRKRGVDIIREVPPGTREWRPPVMGQSGPATVDGAPAAPPTAAQLEALQEQAKQEGFEQGRREGLEFGHREGLEEGRRALLEKIGHLDALMATLQRPFEELDEQVEQEIVTLVISMVRQLVRREVKTDPGHIVGVVREALGILPVSARQVRVVLHPEDAELIREVYALGEAERQWQVVEDPVVQRGGCQVVSETSRVDATLESRLNALIAPLLAGERVADPATGND